MLFLCENNIVLTKIKLTINLFD